MNTSIIEEHLIELQLASRNKRAAIAELAQRLYAKNRLTDLPAFLQAVQEREASGSTGIGFGLAIPHGKSDAVRTASVAFGRCPAGLDWQAYDGEPVHLVFLIAVPQAAADNQHLKILAVLSRKLMHAEFRQQLLQCDDAGAAWQLLQAVLAQAETE